jgi:hypothetical protein
MVQLWTKKYPFQDQVATPIDLLTELEGLHLDYILEKRRFPLSMGLVIRSMLAHDPG